MLTGAALGALAMVAWLGMWNQARSLGARGRALLQLRARHFRPVIALLRGLTDPVVAFAQVRVTSTARSFLNLAVLASASAILACCSARFR